MTTEKSAVARGWAADSVTLKRFDDDTGSDGPGSHGGHVVIQGHGMVLNAQKYGDENKFNIRSGIDESNPEAIENRKGRATSVSGSGGCRC
jgi:hypothetical protein